MSQKWNGCLATVAMTIYMNKKRKITQKYYTFVQEILSIKELCNAKVNYMFRVKWEKKHTAVFNSQCLTTSVCEMVLH